MTWLEGNGADLEPAGIRLKKLIERPGILGVPVHLYLHVKVKPGWDEDREIYRDIGLDWVE